MVHSSPLDFLFKAKAEWCTKNLKYIINLALQLEHEKYLYLISFFPRFAKVL